MRKIFVSPGELTDVEVASVQPLYLSLQHIRVHATSHNLPRIFRLAVFK